MLTFRSRFALLALAGLFPLATTHPAAAQTTQAAPAAHYSVESTPAGKLIDDPAAAAILQKLIPTIWANELFQTSGRELTLRAIQQFETVLTDEKLSEIQAEFNKIPAKP